MYYAYVLQNADGTLYKGHTNDIERRLAQHNATDGEQAYSQRSYTKERGPWFLVYKEELITREEAIKREKYFKTGKGREFLRNRISRAPHSSA